MATNSMPDPSLVANTVAKERMAEIVREAEKPRYKCEKCGKSFDSKEDLEEHLIMHINAETDPAGVG